MSSNFRNNGLGLFLQRLLTAVGILTSLPVLIKTLVEFSKLVSSEGEIIAKVFRALVIAGILVSWGTLAYIYFRPAPIRRKKLRCLALAGMIAVPILTTTGFGFYVWQHYHSQNIIVLVAEFKSLQPEVNLGVTELIIHQLRDATSKYSDVKIQPLNKPIIEQQGSEVARAEGEKRKASMVIWGWYGTKGEKVPLSVHFEVLRTPKKDLPILGPEVNGKIQIIPVADLNSLTLQTHLSQEMAYLSLFTLAMTRYTASDWDGAIARFTDALNQTKEPVKALNQSIVYFYRGSAYLPKKEYDRAIVDFDQALKLQPDLAIAYADRSLVNLLKSDYDRAIADCNQALQLQPKLALAYTSCGYAYASKGDYNSAIADGNKVVKLQPDNAWSYYNRAKIKHLPTQIKATLSVRLLTAIKHSNSNLNRQMHI